ncbi:MAG: peptidoglycan DD-metalloendopeptidase family protein [Bacteroidales bacterium]|nr:peptidoglycan DD-metalloendopeptidase family protein [Bacteroidales bacterium]
MNNLLVKYPAPRFLLASVIILFFCFGWSVSAQTTKDKLNQDRQKLETEIEYTSKLLNQTQKNKETSLRDLQLLNSRIKKREILLNTIGKEINEVNRKIREDQVLINKRSKELKELNEEYARMIYYTYKITKAQNRLLFIFSAKDFNQAYQRLKYYQQYTAYRRKQAERIREAQVALSKQMHALELTRAEKLKLSETESGEKSKLDKEKLLKDRTVQDLSKKEKQLLATLRTNQKALQKLQKEIERILAEEAKARSSDKNRDAGVKAAEMRLSSNFAANKRRLPWPTDQGVVTSTFGEHQHPVLKYVKVNNNGIDIMTGQRAPVKAVFNGVVSKVLSIPNLNMVVMLRHGDYLTVYSNLDEVMVTAGETVVTGQVIGKAYYNADEGKSEINFQIWQAKTIMNPQDWLSNR